MNLRPVYFPNINQLCDWLPTVNSVFRSDLVAERLATLFPPFSSLLAHCSRLCLSQTLAVTSTIPSDKVAHISLFRAAPEQLCSRPKSKAGPAVYSPRVTALRREQWRLLWRRTMLL